MLKDYYTLTKPGIVKGNLVTAAGGFLLASRGEVDFQLFAFMLVGLALVIAAGCVLNNVADRDIDAKMERTKSRAVVTGAVSKRSAIVFGIVLGILGVLALLLHTNFLTMLTALTGLAVYVLIYTPMKRGSQYATLVGSIAGAVPPVVGYAAVTNALDTGALLLFLILVLWQMPHFYAIAIRRAGEYAAADIPALPLTIGIHRTKVHILLYVNAFIIASLLLAVFDYAGYVYLAVMLALGLVWLRLAVLGFKAADDALWARGMFKFSLVVLMTWSVLLALNSFLV